MRLSIMLRGFNYLEADRYGIAMDGRKNADSLLENLIEPVRKISPDAKLYLVTYDSPALAEIVEKFQPCEVVLLKQEGSTQAETFKDGLKYTFGKDEFDALIVGRFDLDFRKPFDQWNVQPDENKIYLPFKEYVSHWRDHRRVGDAVHIIGKNGVSPFYNALIMGQLAARPHLHLMYYFLRTMTPHLHFIEDGYWDSNTLYSNPECDNPLYKIFNRPRYAQQTPTTGLVMGEIRAE